jgi:hypothetical protein
MTALFGRVCEAQEGSAAITEELSVSSLRTIMGIGGGMLGGLAIASPYLPPRDSPLGILSDIITLCVSAIIGSLLPQVGLYAGIGVLLAIVVGTVTRQFDTRWLAVLPHLGACLGFIHMLYIRWEQRGTIHRSQPSSVRTKQTEELATGIERDYAPRWYGWKMAIEVFFLSSVIGAILSLFYGPPCIYVGIVVGVALFLGSAANAIVRRRR